MSLQLTSSMCQEPNSLQALMLYLIPDLWLPKFFLGPCSQLLSRVLLYQTTFLPSGFPALFLSYTNSIASFLLSKLI